MASRIGSIYQGICRGRVYQAALFAVLFSASAIVRSEAQTTNWSSSSLSGTFNYSSGLTGLTQTQGGELALNLQSLSYSIGNGPITPLPTATGVTLSTSGHGQSQINKLTANYSLPGNYNMAWAIGLDGNTWSESMTFLNNSGASADLSLFQYSQFVVGNAPGNQTLSIDKSGEPTQAYIYQNGGGWLLTFNVQNPLIGGTTEVQADNSGAPFGPFNGSATALNNTTVAASGTVEFGVQFNATVANGNSFAPQETGFDPVVVPEPSSVTLVASGIMLLALVFRRRVGVRG